MLSKAARQHLEQAWSEIRAATRCPSLPREVTNLLIMRDLELISLLRADEDPIERLRTKTARFCEHCGSYALPSSGDMGFHGGDEIDQARAAMRLIEFPD